MKVSNLVVGQILKNYKELCGVLEIEPKSGNTKLSQLKELERHCKYHKEGNKFIIDEIFSEAKEKMDKRREGNNNERAKAIRYLLVNLLNSYKNDYETVAFSKYQLLKRLNLINNDNYKNAKLNRKEYAESLEVSELAVNECMELVDNYSINAIKKAIETLRRNSTLLYKYSYTYVIKEGTQYYTIHCGEGEEKLILEAEKEVMEQMNIRSKQKIYEFGRWDEFKYKVKEKLKCYSIFKNLNYYYNSFHFTFTAKTVELELNSLHRRGMNFELANELIKEFWVNKLDDTIENRHNKANEKVFGTPLENMKTDSKKYYKLDENYISDMKKVKNSITDLKHDTVKISEIPNINNIDNESDIPF